MAMRPAGTSRDSLVSAFWSPSLNPGFQSLTFPVATALLITQEEVACEYLKRKRESIRWEDVNRIWYVTTSAGPWLPDEWLVFEGETGGCSFPTEATGMDGLWDELKQRFAGFDYKPLIYGGTDDAKHLCWERRLTSHGT